ncbi:antibiotic biosynthesis monooxygenase family protein [Jiulongibacter sp. NS-SX5]|uniref:antibiotic biosynthesis monooxygenase family protein n=1 Tax=Jiulongibacter sp. NS-SX5 TaxID=3463854 RepID=UPI00405896A0
MITAFIEHTLTVEGEQYFDKWIIQERERLQHFQGFEGIERVSDIQNPERILLFLRFDTVENLKNWSKSAEHGELLANLQKFMKAKPISQLLKT